METIVPSERKMSVTGMFIPSMDTTACHSPTTDFGVPQNVILEITSVRTIEDASLVVTPLWTLTSGLIIGEALGFILPRLCRDMSGSGLSSCCRLLFYVAAHPLPAGHRCGVAKDLA